MQINKAHLLCATALLTFGCSSTMLPSTTATPTPTIDGDWKIVTSRTIEDCSINLYSVPAAGALGGSVISKMSWLGELGWRAGSMRADSTLTWSLIETEKTYPTTIEFTGSTNEDKSIIEGTYRVFMRGVISYKIVDLPLGTGSFIATKY